MSWRLELLGRDLQYKEETGKTKSPSSVAVNAVERSSNTCGSADGCDIEEAEYVAQENLAQIEAEAERRRRTGPTGRLTSMREVDLYDLSWPKWNSPQLDHYDEDERRFIGLPWSNDFNFYWDGDYIKDTSDQYYSEITWRLSFDSGREQVECMEAVLSLKEQGAQAEHLRKVEHLRELEYPRELVEDLKSLECAQDGKRRAEVWRWFWCLWFVDPFSLNERVALKRYTDRSRLVARTC